MFCYVGSSRMRTVFTRSYTYIVNVEHRVIGDN